MKKNKETLKTYFETGDKPTQEQYGNLIDSYVDAKQLPGEANRRFVIDETGEVSVVSEVKLPEYTLSEIVGNKLSLLKDGVVVKEIDLTTYLDDTNLSRLVSGTVDPAGMATFKRDDSSTFTVDFSSLLGGAGVQVQADWSQNISTQSNFIKNKPTDLLKALGPLVKEEEYRLHVAPSAPLDLNSLTFDKNIVIIKDYNDGVTIKNYLFFKVSSNEPYTYTLYDVLNNSYEAHLFSGYSNFMKIKRSDDFVKSGYICFMMYSYNGGLPASSSGLHKDKLHGTIVKSLSSIWSPWRDLVFENNTITATRARWRKKGNVIHLEIVTLSAQDKGFVVTLPPEARPKNSYYGVGSDNNGNVYGITVNGLGGVYVHNPSMKNTTLFFHID